MTRLIRVTFDPDGLTFLVEKGGLIDGSISPEEQLELDNLIDQLEPYGDFTVFKELEPDEIKKVTQLKHSRGVLEKKKREQRMEFIPVPAADLRSIILVTYPDRVTTYVENMPSEWIEKLFAQQLTLNIGATGTTTPLETRNVEDSEVYTNNPELSEKHNKIIEIIQRAGFSDLVEISPDPDSNDFIKVMPKAWLGENWSKIGKILSNEFGEGSAWISQGQGDRTACWNIV